MSSFENKVILITGATSGLGATAAVSLAGKGAKVAITGRREEQGNAVVDQIKSVGGECLFIKTDVTVRADVEAMVAKTVEKFGRLDGAVNNAGIAGAVLTPIADISDEDWFATINTNLNAVFMCMKFEIPAMLASGGGSIVNMSSIIGLAGSDIGHAAYSASKHGVIGLTKTAAFEYAKQGIRVNAVCPGLTHSELVDNALEAIPGLAEKFLVDVPMGRIAETQEIANAVLWLSSDEASFVTGQALAPDGGWLAK